MKPILKGVRDMKNLIRLSIALVCLVGLARAQDVTYNFDQNADFSKYKTYRWEKHPNSVDVDELTLGQLATGFDAELTKKGLTRKDSDPTDLVIVFQIAVTQEKQITTYSDNFGYGAGWGRGWYGYGGMATTTTRGTTTTILIGSIVLDMYDVAAKNLVWRGMASKTIDQKANPEKRQKNINKAAAKMLKNYPPPPPKEK